MNFDAQSGVDALDRERHYRVNFDEESGFDALDREQNRMLDMNFDGKPGIKALD